MRSFSSRSSRSESQVSTGMPALFASASARPIAGAFEGDTAMPSTRRAIRSFTTCTCSSPPPCSPGPTYRHSIAPFSSFSAFLQPSRAWSKNGLLVFFGTSAKTYFLSAAEAGNASTSATSSIARPCFISLPPVVSSRPPPSAQLLQQHRKHDEHADERALPVRIHARHQQRIADHLDQRGTDERTIGTTLAAHQVG